MKTRITKMIQLRLTAVLFGLCLATPIFAGIHGNSHAFGTTLAGWNEIYERWAFGELAIPIDGNGNAVVHPHVVLFPIPNTPGDGTPGHLDVTLTTGQKFVLPLWVLLGTDYTDGTPPDPLLPLSVFRTLNLTFQIDSKTVIDQTNVLNFYSAFFFNPPIPITGFPPVNSIIWFQGISIVHHPLPPGTHTFQLDAVNTQPALGGFLEYHNTWTVTVEPGKK
jgi:hypothetical protein